MRLGNVNGFVKSTGWIGRKSFEFDGTILGLTKSAVAAGAKVGDIVKANFAGFSTDLAKDYEIIFVPIDCRANGFWVRRVI